ncbi:hypothetical protein K502DRAFT_286886 [Neoconidiobolus thromboides FSU 785]|nr:hypothetical protein K502DRAFT_286886 [Neoconidiobolus thromboides FSU 785]
MSISISERDYIIKGIDSGIRTDGRGREDYRQIYIETGILAHASGSARCRLGDGTDVLVGIKAETEPILPTNEIIDEGYLKINVECSPNSVNQFETKLNEEVSSEIAQILQRGLCGPQGGIDLKKLCIIPKNACWCLYIDALVLGISGNLIDAISYAIYAALANTRLPMTVIEDVGDNQFEFEVIDDDNQSIPVPGWENVPILTTLSKIGDRYILDSTNMEEHCSDAALHVAINSKGNICGVQKSGDKSIDPSMLIEMLTTAQTIGSNALHALNLRISEEKEEIEKIQQKGGVIKKMGFMA